MGKVCRGAAFLAAVILPAAGMAQPPEPRDRRATRGASFEEEGESRGIVEHQIRVAPVEEEIDPALLQADLPERERPEWPNEHLYDGWDWANAYTFPQLYPNLAARLFHVVGDADGATNYVARLETELYLLHFGVDLVDSIGGERTDRTWADVDLRIPIGLGGGHRLALLPGLSFPIDEGEKNEANTNVRAQAIWGFAGNGLGLQLRAGITEGTRPAGVIDVGRRLIHTAALYGGLASWRVGRVVQLRVEGSGEIATESGADDRLTLLPGVVFFPWGDPRLHLGISGVAEWASEGLSDAPLFGGLIDLGIFFL